jgi:hypothetical protein
MTVSRLRAGRPREPQTFGRAHLSRPLVLLLVVLRWYALVAVGVAIYSFFHALK